MYNTLLILHSICRWLVLGTLLTAIYRSYKGYFRNIPFSKLDNSIRHWTATIAHIQLIFGLWLYFISPIINYFLHNYKDAVKQSEIRFFGMEHSVMMLMSITIITITSFRAKRKGDDKEKFKTILIGYSLALLIILIMIPWPFSPFASRPFIR